MNAVASNILTIDYTGSIYTRSFCPTSMWLTANATGAYVTNLADVQTLDGIYSVGGPAYMPAGGTDEASAFGYDFSLIPQSAIMSGLTWTTDWRINEVFVAGDREIVFIRTGAYNVNLAPASVQPV